MSVSEKTYARDVELPPFPGVENDYLPDAALVHFHFAPHATAEHFDAASEHLKVADIYIPEAVGWDASELRDINAISKGDKKAIARAKFWNAKDPMGAYCDARNDALARTYKPVLLVDASADQRSYLTGQAYWKTFGVNADDHLEKLADTMSVIARRAAMRDRIIVGNLGQKVSELVVRHPRLAKKPTVNVLCTLGNAHGEVYDYLAAQEATKENVQVSYWSSLGYHVPEQELVDTYRRQKAPTRRQLIRAVTALALAGSELPGLDEGRTLYNALALVSRKPDAHFILGATMLELMMEEPEEALQWAFKTNTLKAEETADSQGLEYLCSMATRADALLKTDATFWRRAR